VQVFGGRPTLRISAQTGMSASWRLGMLWGTFGDTRIREDHVRKHHYDDETWRGLQQLKKQVDAGDLFYTRFTVQMP
jgi:hypothetical protein